MANSRTALIKNIDSLIMTVTEMPNNQSRMSDGKAAFVIGFHAFLSEKKAALLKNEAHTENDVIIKAIADDYMAFSTKMLSLLTRLDKLDFLVIDTKIAVNNFDSEKRRQAFDKHRQTLLKFYNHTLLADPALFVEVNALETLTRELCHIDQKAQTANQQIALALDQKSICIKNYHVFFNLCVATVNDSYITGKDATASAFAFKTISDTTKQIFNQQPLDIAALEREVAAVDKIYVHLCNLSNKGKTPQEIIDAFNVRWKKHQASSKADEEMSQSAESEDDEFLKKVAALHEWSEPHATVIRKFKEEVTQSAKSKDKLIALKAKYTWYEKVNDIIASVINLKINIKNQTIPFMDVITYDFINDISKLYENNKLTDEALASTIITKYQFYVSTANEAKIITETPRNNPLVIMNVAIDDFQNKVYDAYKANNTNLSKNFVNLLALNQVVVDFLNFYPVHVTSNTDTQSQTDLKAMVIAIITSYYQNNSNMTAEKLVSVKSLLDDLKEFSRLFHALASHNAESKFVFLTARKDCQQLFKHMQKIESNLTAKQFDCLVAEIERLRNNALRVPQKKKFGKLGSLTLQNPLAKLINKEFASMIASNTAKPKTISPKMKKLLLAFFVIVAAIACGLIFGYAAPVALAASLNPSVAFFGAWLVKIGTAAVVALASTVALAVIGAVGAVIAGVYRLTHVKKSDAANSKVSNSQATIGKGLPRVAGKNLAKKNSLEDDAEISDTATINDSSTLVDGDDLDLDDKVVVGRRLGAC